MEKIIQREKNIIILLTLCIIVLNLIGYNLLPVEAVTTFFEGLFICIPFIINFLLIGIGYNKERVHINKIMYPALNLILSWFISFIYYQYIYNEVSNNLSIFTCILGSVAFLIFNVFYTTPEKSVISMKHMCVEGLTPILKQQETFFSSATNFLILFHQSKIKISSFIIIKKKKEEIYYAIFRSPNVMQQYSLISYLREKDISDLNMRYLTVTSYSNKIINFNKIINYLIQHFHQSKKTQEENGGKLFSFISKFENEKTSSFEIVPFLNFIFKNNHLIPEILLFLETLNLKDIQNCQIDDLNTKEINILYSLIKIYPFLINSLHFKKDQKQLQKTLYKFFNSFKNFNKNDSLDLKNCNILPIFLKFAFYEENLNLDKFTNDIIKIFKGNK